MIRNNREEREETIIRIKAAGSDHTVPAAFLVFQLLFFRIILKVFIQYLFNDAVPVDKEIPDFSLCDLSEI